MLEYTLNHASPQGFTRACRTRCSLSAALMNERAVRKYSSDADCKWDQVKSKLVFNHLVATIDTFVTSSGMHAWQRHSGWNSINHACSKRYDELAKPIVE